MTLSKPIFPLRLSRAHLAATVVLLLHTACAPAMAAQMSDPEPDAMATQPDPRDFVTKVETNLSALGNPLRFGGLNISWLGLRTDTGRPEDLRTPTPYEIADIFKTVHMMGAGFIRIASLAAPAGCPLCLTQTVTASGAQTSPDALTHIDHILRLAHDAGEKIVVPLAGSGHCATTGPLDPVSSTQCVYARAHGLPDAAFYTNATVRGDFVRHVVSLLNHVNPETGLAWKDDPTIMAWENCDACGDGIDAATLADWTEYVGRAIKAVDTRHLYENGAFAGRLGHQPNAVAASSLASPSVDIIGDRLSPQSATAPDFFAAAQDAVNKAGRIYIVDSYAWSPAHWASSADFQAFLTAMLNNRALSGAFVNDFGGHADRGGWLPPTQPNESVLYFPGAPTAQADLATMQVRARAVRRFSYHMMDLEAPAFSPPAAPEIISAHHGHIIWRGAAGATTYSISRSSDITQIGSWTELCDQCVTDANPAWQDPSPPTGNFWYRLTTYNSNLHLGHQSEPVQDK